MKILFFDCFSGISGDMALAALIELGVEPESLQRVFDSLGLGTIRLVRSTVRRRGFRGTQVHFEHTPDGRHRHLSDILRILERAELREDERQMAVRIFRTLAEAEAAVHGCDVERVHFHEVGAIDSICDIVGFACALRRIGADRVESSPVPVGCGSIEIAHGRVSLPAPATALLLRGVPLAPSAIEAELTTPTGAALLACAVERFAPGPVMTIRGVGWGAGSRDLAEQANLLRVYLGDGPPEDHADEEIVVLESNLDDVSAEILAHCAERLRQAGALDVSLTPLAMKKHRLAHKITVLAEPPDAEPLRRILFQETRTLGIRWWTAQRQKLSRTAVTVLTAHGPVAGQTIRLPDGRVAFTPEYESCRKVSDQAGLPLIDVYEAAHAAAAATVAAPPTNSPDGEGDA